MTFSVPCPSASGARYLTNQELRKSEAGRNQKKCGCCPAWPVLQFRSFRKKETAPPTMTPAIVARKTHLMMLRNSTVDSVRDFLTTGGLMEIEGQDGISGVSVGSPCTQARSLRRRFRPSLQRHDRGRVGQHRPAD